jgi:thymidine phosphorylase
VVVHEHVPQLVLIEPVELVDHHRHGGVRPVSTVALSPVAHHASIARIGARAITDTPGPADTR